MKTTLNFLYLLISKGAGLLLFAIATPLLVNRVGLAGLGIVSIVVAFATILDAFVEYSFNVTVVKEIAVNRHSVNNISKIFYNTLFSKLFLMVIGIIISTIIIFTIPKYYEIRNCLFASFLFTLGRCVMPIWYFMAMEKMQGITFVSLTTKLGYCLFIYYAVKLPEHVFRVILSWSIIELIPSFLALLYVIFYDKIHFSKPTIKSIVSLLRKDFFFSLSLLLFRAYSFIPVLFIGQMFSEVWVGIFSIADKIIAIIKDTIGLLFNSILPRISYLYMQNKLLAKDYLKKTLLFFGIVYFAILVSLNLFSNYIIIFFTKYHLKTISNLILILSFSCIFVFFRIPFSIYTVLENKDKNLTFVVALTLFSLIGLLVYLPAKLQLAGVAYSILISDFLFIGFMYFSMIKYLVKK